MLFYTIQEANSINAKYHGEKPWLNDPFVDQLRDRDWIYDNAEKQFKSRRFNGNYKKLPKEYRAAGCMIPVDYALGKKKVNTPDGLFHNYSQLPDDTDYIYIFLTWDEPDLDNVNYPNQYYKNRDVRVFRVYKDIKDRYFELYGFDMSYMVDFRIDEKHKANRYFSKDERKIITKFFEKYSGTVQQFYNQPWYFFDYFQERNDLEVTAFEYQAFNFKLK